MNEKRNAWVKKTVENMRNAEKNNPCSVGAVVINNNKVVVTITKSIDNPLIGVAVCKPDDEFDLDTGIAIAYTKAKGQTLPCFITCDGCDDDEYEDWDEDEEEDNDVWDDEDDDDTYYDEDDDDEDSEDDDGEDELLTLDDIKIGTRFIDMDGDLDIKVSESSYYAYAYEEVFTIDSDRPFVKTIV